MTLRSVFPIAPSTALHLMMHMRDALQLIVSPCISAVTTVGIFWEPQDYLRGSLTYPVARGRHVDGNATSRELCPSAPVAEQVMQKTRARTHSAIRIQ
jgi:hypothetical protein